MSSFSRPGGGHGSSGPSHSSPSSPSHSSPSSPSHSSSSGSHSSSGGPQTVLSLEIEAILLVVFVVFILVVRASAQAKRGAEWSSRAPEPTPPPKRSPRVRTQLASQLVRFDPEFSLVLFEDFVYALYARVHELRGKGRDYREVAPYLAPGLVPPNSGGDALTEVRGIIIGAMGIVDASVTPDGSASATVEIESNYEEIVRGVDGPRAYYAREQWTLARRAGLKSRPPERARSIGCPNCGASLRDLRDAKCSYCNTRVDPGVFDWQVLTMTELERSARAPELTGTTEETGTELPTVVAPQAAAGLRAIAAADSAFTYEAFLRRLGVIFAEFQVAWSARDLKAMRPFLSDALFQTELYWVETYERAKLTNKTQNARITRVELANVIRDARYDAITMRVFATSLDFTVRDADQVVVGGSKTSERAYSEYWTLIRGARAGTTERPAKQCPNCGGGLDVNMAGACVYCNAKITSGEFDWVLSRIEQDEVYG